MVICCYESRPDSEFGLRLLVMSICRFSPNVELHIHFPPADEEFRDWIRAFKNVELKVENLGDQLHWNVKPAVLLREMNENAQDIIWLDSDVVVSGPLETLFQHCQDTLVIAEEALWGSHSDEQAMRARLWGLPVGREFPFSLNTCALRVTQHHRTLIQCWEAMLEGEDYQRNQSIKFGLRPPHMAGDQDVLTALLSSDQFAEIPVKILRRGSEIIQAFGLKAFTTRERLTSLGRLPPLIHSQGAKPWLPAPAPQSLMSYLDAAYLDASPYSLVALTFSVNAGALSTKTKLGSFLRAAGLGSPQLTGLPLAIFFDICYGAVRIIKAIHSLFRPRGSKRAAEISVDQ